MTPESPPPAVIVYLQIGTSLKGRANLQIGAKR